jgi:hypothetical protein
VGSGAVLRAAGLLLLIFGGLAIFAAATSAYGIDHNAYYTCDAQPRPEGSLPYEAGYAGHGSVFFPVAGVRCDWNAVDGGTFSTIIPDIPATVIGWVALVFPVAGVTALVIRTVAGDRRLDAPSGSSS